MKDGRTHLAHKQEQAVDLDTGAVLAVTLTGGAAGDTTTLPTTLAATTANLATVAERGDTATPRLAPRLAGVVADKGYHSNAVLVTLTAADRSYIAEPDRGRRDWTDKATERPPCTPTAVASAGAAARRCPVRGELLERPFATRSRPGDAADAPAPA